MSKTEVVALLQRKGYGGGDFKITPKDGGVQVEATKRIPNNEFDYNEFVYEVLEGKVAKDKVHFLDNWTFTIECE